MNVTQILRDRLRDSLTEVTTAVAVMGDEETEYVAMRKRLPPVLREALAAARAESEEPDLTTTQHHWVLCSMPEGEFPRVSVYPQLSRLVEAIAKLEGQEVAVWAMFGVPLRLTQRFEHNGGNARYILLPSQTAALVAKGVRFEILPQSEIPDGLAIEEDGWLGDNTITGDDYFVPGFVDDEDKHENEDEDEEQDGASELI